MEPKNRNVWIILAVIVVVLCCCALALAAGGAAWYTTRSFEWPGAASVQGERSEEPFVVGEAPSLEIHNIAGNVTVRVGQSGLIWVAATRKARNWDDLERIGVEVVERDGGLVLTTSKPSNLKSASVDLEITTPAGTRLEVDTGAGNVDIGGITGEMDAYSGAGNIRYQGTPQGECRFETGAGNIRLTLPADLNVQVDLDTGMGNIDMDFSVDGQVTRREVRGVIGSGEQGTIYAHTGAGNIDLVLR